MEKVGDFLKSSRQDRQISLHEISERTKIQQHYLEALERGDFKKFSGEVYLKGALRSYAESIGLDPGEVMELYRRRKGEAEPEEPAAPVEKASAQPRVPRGEGSPSFVYGIIVLALLLAAGGYWLSSLDSPVNPFKQSHTNSQAGHVDPGKPGPPSEGEAGGDEAEPVVKEAEIKLSTEESTAQETVFTVSNTERLKLELSSGEACWIKALMDDREQFEPRNLRSDEGMTLEASEKIWIRLGNPRSIKIILNGIEVKGISGKKDPHNILFIRS